jgi:hypothetical protein
VRRTRRRRRFHTDRIVRNRRARYQRETSAWMLDQWPRALPYGLLADSSPWAGAGGGKWLDPRRARESREWRQLVDAAY